MAGVHDSQLSILFACCKQCSRPDVNCLLCDPIKFQNLVSFSRAFLQHHVTWLGCGACEQSLRRRCLLFESGAVRLMMMMMMRRSRGLFAPRRSLVARSRCSGITFARCLQRLYRAEGCSSDFELWEIRFNLKVSSLFNNEWRELRCLFSPNSV
jgi:hypothetical protein